MKAPLSSRVIVLSALLFVCSASVSHASLTFTSGLGTTHAGNLVVNGSFELPPVPDGSSINFLTGVPGAPILGWKGSGPAASNAAWGNDGPVTPYRLRASDDLPDGRLGVYFENGQNTTVSPTPTFNPNGTVNFASPPNFTTSNGGPVILNQVVPTHLSGGTSFKMSFWVSGEESRTVQGFPYAGILGFRISNVLPGDPIQWLAVPNGLDPNYGFSKLYEYTFTPLVPTSPVSINFIGWGHIDLFGTPGLRTTEAILDDVIINAIPEPSTLTLAGIGGVALLTLEIRRRRAM